MAMKPQLWTANGIATETGFTHRTVGKALARCPVVDKRGRANCYFMRDVLPILFANAERTIDLGQQRARQHKAMAEKLEMENAKRKGELGEIKEFSALWETLTTELRQRLAMIGARTAQEFARTKRKGDAKKIIDGEVRSALEGFTRARAGLQPGA